ncbi:UDP-N-acetylmuramoyl-L-alanyl-D-glutamate--2,6-diaminopimelate ligase [Zobellia galactanivorans]|uniref:UDP-N-acetylmuramoyl-L-alanyl-D-glutamate--2, 6-diaminopimelate ligase n=1 Tax=Zobellia TaxID=112040 RepID=UPI00061AA739|nr:MULTISPECIES: UDP-N-acetylmuramoyl-L-alanyl-D-glutamate--2,6-diaminopimelate ligase [Zobellia]MBU3027432.1 UDP-N-acetylmuramoyl-L-alanyl-D-glutamate--2,6-diaminopimelate ligase [Zobellia galactanivorans]MDO6809469.1 UDP-N-acetylmuramoyl-L-alanyl-D-glutamate--2,6-diaminopimelate ligase [Zobellia galactanivorans]OWW24350.1 UDP-N-acetylmuramoyl-L-alanyl-D-glutamate--2,6-diaminopimelate ligase [Zobellia sp. OII3]
MRLLKDILFGASLTDVIGSTNVLVNNIRFDSRKVEMDDVFVAIKGTLTDGHLFIGKAIDLGAKAIVCETLPEQIIDGVTYVEVKDGNTALAMMASNFYGNPSKNLKLVGVTGTNGKTTISSLLYQLFKKAGYKVGLLSTIKIMVDDQVYATSHTTPDALTINAHLHLMNEAGVEFCFMEVSSHGIHQKRTQGLTFEGAIFTNLSHDHLDYHKTFAEYRDTKKILFDQLPKTAFALSNIDDKNGAVMLQNTKAKKYTYALRTYANYRAQVLESQFSGTLLKINEHELWSRLIGHFNAYNMLAIFATADLLGMETLETLRLLSELENVDGRFQYFISSKKITAIVDYAHTPDALKNVLETISTLRTGNENVITVVGCGGDRDSSKRPVMGHIASQLSDKAIFTSDNPRGESPIAIIDAMEKGVEPQNVKKILSIENREQAIKTACQLANAEDIILIAGKGHETYQETNGKRIHFDDFETVKDVLKRLDK